MFLARTRDPDLLVEQEMNDEKTSIKLPEDLDPTI